MVSASTAKVNHNATLILLSLNEKNMLSKCGSCGGFGFAIKEVSPSGAAFKKVFIQCSLCGVPVGVTDFYDTHSAIENTNTKIRALGDKLNSLEHTLRQIVSILNTMR